MANVLNETINDRETAALGVSVGEEFGALTQMCAGNREQRGAEIQGHQNIIRAVDGVVYDQYYLRPTEESLQIIVGVAEEAGLVLRPELVVELQKIKDILGSGDAVSIEQLVQSIEQLRLFDARDKDINREVVSHHPITIDIKFKAADNDVLNRKNLKWSANENGDQKMTAAMGVIKTKYGRTSQGLGHVRRHSIAYEWLPPTVVESVMRQLCVGEISAQAREDVLRIIADEFSVKLDVRYDVVVTPEGREVKLVTREVELDGDTADLRLGLVQDALRDQGYMTFVSRQLNFGDLALAKNPNAMVDALLTSSAVGNMRMLMNAQVVGVGNFFGSGWGCEEFRRVSSDQIVVDLPEKGEVLSRLTRVGNIDNVRGKLPGF